MTIRSESMVYKYGPIGYRDDLFGVPIRATGCGQMPAGRQ